MEFGVDGDAVWRALGIIPPTYLSAHPFQKGDGWSQWGDGAGWDKDDKPKSVI